MPPSYFFYDPITAASNFQSPFIQRELAAVGREEQDFKRAYVTIPGQRERVMQFMDLSPWHRAAQEPPGGDVH